ncbi:hypothetical protein ACFPOA_05755 [Lysobacter niabensis]|uniref:hypothetical protein n=1 Tax=Agrilutibacter niabensis TaxID=380628 RepID=UPI003606DF03
MGALSDLLKRAEAAATPATHATQPSVTVRESQQSQESQRGEPEKRAHLLNLADAEGADAARVHRLHADDVTACTGLSDETLRAYLRALDRGTDIDRGIAPDGYTQAAHCEGCGPVWLWQGAPSRVVACPWCSRRKAGKPLPRPKVTCGDCINYLPDPLNPKAGMGGCALGAARAYWPVRRHRCAEHVPTENRWEQSDSLMISQSVEVPQ